MMNGGKSHYSFYNPFSSFLNNLEDKESDEGTLSLRLLSLPNGRLKSLERRPRRGIGCFVAFWLGI